MHYCKVIQRCGNHDLKQSINFIINSKRDKEIDESRYQQDFQRRVLVDREIRELTSRFINDRNHLENENKKLRQDFDELRLKHGSFDDVFQQAT